MDKSHKVSKALPLRHIAILTVNKETRINTIKISNVLALENMEIDSPTGPSKLPIELNSSIEKNPPSILSSAEIKVLENKNPKLRFLTQNGITITYPMKTKANINGQQSLKALTVIATTPASDEENSQPTKTLPGVSIIETNTKIDSIRKPKLFDNNNKEMQRRPSLPNSDLTGQKQFISDEVTKILNGNSIPKMSVPVIAHRSSMDTKMSHSNELNSLEQKTNSNNEINIRNISSLKELHAIAAEKISIKKDGKSTPPLKTVYKDEEIILELKCVPRKNTTVRPTPPTEHVNENLTSKNARCLSPSSNSIPASEFQRLNIGNNIQLTIIEKSVNKLLTNNNNDNNKGNKNNKNNNNNINNNSLELRNVPERNENGMSANTRQIELNEFGSLSLARITEGRIKNDQMKMKLPVTPEKQDSALKFEINGSPRDKRSKSLYSPSVRSTVSNIDRRYSSASDSKVSIITMQSETSIDLCSDNEMSDDYDIVMQEAGRTDVKPEGKVNNESGQIILTETDSNTIVQKACVAKDVGSEKEISEVKSEAKSNESDSNVITVNKTVKVNKKLKVYTNTSNNKSANRSEKSESKPATQRIKVKSESSLCNPVDANDVHMKVIQTMLQCNEKMPAAAQGAKGSVGDGSKLKPQSLLRNGNKTQPEMLDSFSSVLDMLSIFNMLTWKERIGAMHSSKLRFHLNEFNLLQLHEPCAQKRRIHTAYEKPIYERETLPVNNDASNVQLYYCRRCNCHGPPDDFLAPEFCSLKCLKRDSRKTRQPSLQSIKKRPRKDPLLTRNVQGKSENHASKKCFDWSTYLPNLRNAIPAPVDLFLNPFPTGPNLFKIGMKLEAIDPDNCSLFCVCTVIDVQGYRLKLTFDGYSSMYDFWVNADSMDIFPPGWCSKTNRMLQPPRGVSADKFSWSQYLSKCEATAAPRTLFTHLNTVSLPWRNVFKIGMHLEAEDLNDTGKLCVATVADVLNDRIRIHFDGWDECYDYWVDTTSPYIHPCGWHQGRQQLVVPPDCHSAAFEWPAYIMQTGTGAAAQSDLFVTREPLEFKPNMKLEVVDPRNPSLIRPATVIGRNRHRVKIHLDCWPNEYCFWLEDDSPDLHPIGWCDSTGHHLEPPPGFKMDTNVECNIDGCRGIGNAKNYLLDSHNTSESCPYALQNWRHKIAKPKRLSNDKILKVNPNKLSIKKVDNIMENMANNQSNDKTYSCNERERLPIMQDYDKTSESKLQYEKQLLQPPIIPKIELITNDFNGLLSETHQQTNDWKPIMLTKQTSLDKAENPTDFGIEIAKNYLCDYGPRLIQNYEIWQKNFTINLDNIVRSPLKWNTVETAAYIDSLLGNRLITNKFESEDIDGAALLLLQQADLTDILGLKLGPSVKIFNHILQLRTLVARSFNRSIKA